MTAQSDVCDVVHLPSPRPEVPVPSVPPLSPLSALGGGRRLSAEALREEAEAFAATLQQVGGPVVLRLSQDPSSVSALLAALWSGVDVALVSSLLGDDAARAAMERLSARAALEVEPGRLAPLAEADAPPRAAGGTVALLTSGSTGEPRFALHTWTSLRSAARPRPALAGRRWLVAFPLAHMAGLQVFAQALLTGGALVVPGDFSVEEGLACLREHTPEHLNATPTYVRQLLRGAPRGFFEGSSLRHVTLGGEIADQPLLDAIAKALPGARVTHVYATTELGAAVSVSDGREGFAAARLGDSLRVEGGELYVRRGEGAMRGYHTEHGAIEESAESEEWIATGDLVEVVGDRVCFRGRAGDVINVGGSKVRPHVVEEVLRELPFVDDAVVRGKASAVVGQHGRVG